MKVQFEFSAADLAEVCDRAVSRSPLIRKWRVRAKLAWAVLFGLIAFVIVPASLELRFGLSLVVAASIIIAISSQVRTMGGNPRVREFYRERLGSDGPFLCEVEITPEGVIARQLGTEMRHAWPQVASISEVPGGIEFVYRPIGSMIVRDRAFSSAQARAQFFELARRYVPAPVTLNGEPLR